MSEREIVTDNAQYLTQAVDCLGEQQAVVVYDTIFHGRGVDRLKKRSRLALEHAGTSTPTALNLGSEQRLDVCIGRLGDWRLSAGSIFCLVI